MKCLRHFVRSGSCQEYAPLALQAYTTLFDLVGQSTLTPAEQQIAFLAVSVLHGCEYCVAGHTYLARSVGLPEAALSLSHQCPPFNSLNPPVASVAICHASSMSSRYPRPGQVPIEAGCQESRCRTRAPRSQRRSIDAAHDRHVGWADQAPARSGDPRPIPLATNAFRAKEQRTQSGCGTRRGKVSWARVRLLFDAPSVAAGSRLRKPIVERRRDPVYVSFLEQLLKPFVTKGDLNTLLLA